MSDSDILIERDHQALAPGTLTFRCNLCGDITSTDINNIRREGRSCRSCESTVRMRQLAWILSELLFGKALAIPDFPIDKSISGLGLSDPRELSYQLRERVNYVNTYLDDEPQLDISDIPAGLEGKFDFIISSEVFEHVAPPIERSFQNLYRLLKPGGFVIFSVPYQPEGETVEHFPELHDYRIDLDDRGAYLVNRTTDGVIQIRRNLEFHPGRRPSLELRMFSLPGVLACFSKNKFYNIKVWDQTHFEFGIYMTERWGLPITAFARKDKK